VLLHTLKMRIHINIVYNFVRIALLSFSTYSCVDSSTAQVEYSGALRTIMSGNLEATISIDTLSQKKHLYALGAMADLKGEIQIFDSKPSNSVVVDSRLQINDSYAVKAALLVYAQVEQWEAFTMENISTKEELENRIFETAKSNGVPVDAPFPFLLEGEVATMDWHVIQWKEGDTIHNHNKHKEAGLNGALKNRDVEIIGFYSTKHKAVFTHHSTNMHMHFKTDDDTMAGHVDDLVLDKKFILKLPR
jgi:alpha-acetolactate decarboxylase